MRFLVLNTDIIKSVDEEGNRMKTTFPSIERNLWLYFRFEHPAFTGPTRPLSGLSIHYESLSSNLTKSNYKPRHEAFISSIAQSRADPNPYLPKRTRATKLFTARLTDKCTN